MSALAAAGAGAFIGFQRQYYPNNSIGPIYFEVAVWSMLALAIVACFNHLKLWRKRWRH